MTMHRLRPLLNPVSVAVLGASQKVGTVGNEVLVNLVKGGFSGKIFAVNPAYVEVQGFPCFPCLAELPELPEMVIFAVGDKRIEAALDDVIALGIKACTIFSALILDGDSAPLLKERIRAKAEQSDLLIAGANGMGFYNVRDRVIAGGFDTRDHPYPGNVTLISQSGAGMSGIVDCEERIDFNLAVSSGYELTVSMEDYLDYALDCPETVVVGLFLETSRHPDKLIAAFQKAQRRQIPILVLKVGCTALAAELAISHSGALAGSDDCYSALFDYYGVQRVDDMDQLATALIMFAQPNAVADGALVCLHDSGGERQLLIDLADNLGVPLASLNNVTVTQLEAQLDPGLPAINPLDGWGAGGPNASANMAGCFTTILADTGAALGAVIHDRGPNSQLYGSYLDYLRQAHKATGKPVFLVANRQGSGTDNLAITSTKEGFPVVDGVSQFLRGAGLLLGYRDFQRREPMQLQSLDQHKVTEWRRRLSAEPQISEAMASECLNTFGIPMVLGRVVSDIQQLLVSAGSMAFPMVLKTAEPGFEHKSDISGVVLDIRSEASLIEAFKDLSQRLGNQVMVAPMIQSEGVEMLLGIASDNQFGPFVVVGFGGIHAEVLNDVRLLRPPFDSAAVKRALDSLLMSELLDGVRGQSAVDVQSYCLAAAQLSAFALSFADIIAEIDVNPMKIMPHGCLGLDALLIKRLPIEIEL